MMDTTSAPARSLEQRISALERANVVRIYRAGLKRDIADGETGRTAMDVIAEPNELEDTWKVFELILAMPKIGRVKANSLLRAERISPSKTVGGLSDRQRGALLRALWGLPSVRGGMVLA